MSVMLLFLCFHRHNTLLTGPRHGRRGQGVYESSCEAHARGNLCEPELLTAGIRYSQVRTLTPLSLRLRLHALGVFPRSCRRQKSLAASLILQTPSQVAAPMKRPPRSVTSEFRFLPITLSCPLSGLPQFTCPLSSRNTSMAFLSGIVCFNWARHQRRANLTAALRSTLILRALSHTLRIQ